MLWITRPIQSMWWIDGDYCILTYFPDLPYQGERLPGFWFCMN